MNVPTYFTNNADEKNEILLFSARFAKSMGENI